MKRAWALVVALGCTPEDSSRALPDPIVAKSAAPKPTVHVTCPPELPAEGAPCALTKPRGCRYEAGKLLTKEPEECVCHTCECKNGKFHCRRHDNDD